MQLTEYPSEARNAAVTTVRRAAYDEVERVLLAAVDRADQQLGATPSFQTAEAVLFAADEYLREFGTTANAAALPTSARRLYQHPETFTQLGRTLQGGSSMADLAKTVRVNVEAADGTRHAVRLFGVSDRGGQPFAVRVAEAKQAMMLPRYQGCVFAVLVESAGHWNLARRTPDGVVFVDYQTDRVDKQGHRRGPTRRWA
ncbi:MAG TPA: hypothetical protein DGT23_26745 [Micromonosporaceae bacterium]|nr:hypothetical protein [Micromonosporaceae bacterium]